MKSSLIRLIISESRQIQFEFISENSEFRRLEKYYFDKFSSISFTVLNEKREIFKNRDE